MTQYREVNARYHEVKRKAHVGERIRIVNAAGTLGDYGKDDEFIVTKSDRGGVYVDKFAEGWSRGIYVFHSEYVVLDPVEPAPDYGDAVARLTLELAEVKRRLGVIERAGRYDEAWLEQLQRTVNDIRDKWETDISALDERVISLEEAHKPKNVGELKAEINVDTSGFRRALDEAMRTSARQLAEKIRDELPWSRSRKSVVKQARADIEALKCGGEVYKVDDPDEYNEPWICNADFVVNREKRLVVCLLRGRASGNVYARGIARCAPDDVFNADIGKAIALRRALGLDVPREYVHAPKPEGIAVGDIAAWKTQQSVRGRVISVGDYVNIDYSIGWDIVRDAVKVIDDTDREEYRQ